MRNSFRKKWVIVAMLLVTAIVVFTFSTNRRAIDFNTEVKPILNAKCISCHGGVKRESGFSVLFRSEALEKNESGKPAIIPGDPENSEMIRRLKLDDPEERMPYKHDPLTSAEIKTLSRWIKEGAVWGNHWAYVPVAPVEVPELDDPWINNEIDQFVLEGIRAAGLKPSERADKATLLRRVSLDLIGMPVPGEKANQFIADSSDTAYEVLVDSLLASPAYGERWTSLWLDLARYADTKGYERDPGRNIWRYRDWLIRAFNSDMPYNQFLVEQLAGDLMPGASDETLIATAFHRNTMTNDEGGTDNEEFRTAAVIDRVNTTWETLMGTSFACVQCHSHPYDPFTHEEYYKFLAFFNNSRDDDTYEDYPQLRHFNDSMSKELDQLKGWLKARESQTNQIIRFLKTWEPSIHSLTADSLMNSELNDTKWLLMRDHGTARLQNIDLQGKKTAIYRYRSGVDRGTLEFRLDAPNGPLLTSTPVKKSGGWNIVSLELPLTIGTHDLYLRYLNPSIAGTEKGGMQFDWFHFTAGFPGEGDAGFAEQKKRFWSLLTASTPQTPVMIENPLEMRRATHVFERGNWLVKGKEVSAGVPASLNPFPAGATRDRFGMALWLTDKQNPLTARTMVNRLWEQLFGTGLVETLEDLGTQGAQPVNRDLLDWLAGRFMQEHKWSIKGLLKDMVMSATYQQASKLNKQMIDEDPYNKLLARGPRVRLSAEQLRDQGLVISGLMDTTMYGRSVMPYQPDGIWLSPYSGNATWKTSNGSAKFRRAVYTYWKRTAPYPAMISFDAASREICTSRRIKTNTPLQALVTLNDESFLDMARALASRMQTASPGDAKEQIAAGFKLATHKDTSSEALTVMHSLYQKSLQSFQKDPYRTCEMVGVERYDDNPPLAALVVVANAILNLDEMIMKN